MYMTSSNEAGMAIAKTLGAERFVELMNEKAKQLGMKDTYFANPTGLDEDTNNTYSTVYDLAILTRYLIKHFPEVVDISSTEHIYLPITSDHQDYDMYSGINLLTTYPGVMGFKTGFTPQAGLTLITLARKNGHEVVGARMVKTIADRLRLPVEARNKLWRLVRWHMFTYSKEMTDAAIRRFIRRVGKDEINDMMLLRVGDRKGGGSRATSWRLRELQERIGTLIYDPLNVTDMAVDGHDVMAALGIKPGPQVGKVLNALFEEVLEDTNKNNREYLLERIKQPILEK